MALHHTESSASRPTTLEEQIERLVSLLEGAGTIHRRVEGIANTLVGPYPVPDDGAGEPEPMGQVSVLRSLLDELERRQRRTSYALDTAENALRDQQSIASSAAASGKGSAKGDW